MPVMTLTPVVAGNRLPAQTTDMTMTVEKGKKKDDIVFQRPGAGEEGTTGRSDRPPKP